VYFFVAGGASDFDGLKFTIQIWRRN